VVDQIQLPGSAWSKSFGAVAERYDRYRPRYPAVALEWVLAALDRRPERVLDLGAGTGKLTEALVACAPDVVAVEPDAGMLAILKAPGRFDRPVEAHVGSAQAIPLPAESVDAVFAGQAFHWFPRPESEDEIARVLRPGGVLGLLWNLPDREVEWVPKLYAATRDERRGSIWAMADPVVHRRFSTAEQKRFATVHELPGPDGVLNLVHTWSWVTTRPADEQAAIDERVRELIAAYPALQQDVVSLPTNTLAIRHVLQ